MNDLLLVDLLAFIPTVDDATSLYAGFAIDAEEGASYSDYLQGWDKGVLSGICIVMNALLGTSVDVFDILEKARAKRAAERGDLDLPF